MGAKIFYVLCGMARIKFTITMTNYARCILQFPIKLWLTWLVLTDT